MKRTAIFFCLLILATTNLFSQQSDFPKLSGPYLGQKPPGMTPEIFVPGSISNEEYAEYGAHFSPDLSEFYFTRNSPSTGAMIWISKITNGVWSEPEIVDFMKEYRGGESCLSPDGKYFFYVWLNRTSDAVEHDIYKAERNEHGWNTPIKLTDIDLGSRRISPSVASNGNLYFSGDFDNPGQKDIYYSEFINGKYTTPINLGKNVNSEYPESHVYVSPDEKFVLFDSHRPCKFGKSNIYISIRTKDGMWSEATDVGSPVNSDYSDWYPTITSDGKYLMFSRNINEMADLMWVDVNIIDELRPKE